jgi:hypothetical protein
MERPIHPFRFIDYNGIPEGLLVAEAKRLGIEVYCNPHLAPKCDLPVSYLKKEISFHTERNPLFYFEKLDTSALGFDFTYASSSSFRYMKYLEETWKRRAESNSSSAYRMFYRMLPSSKKPEECIYLGGQRFVTVDEANRFLGIKPEDCILIRKTKDFFDFEYTLESVPIVDGESNFKRHRFIRSIFEVGLFEDNRVVSFGNRSKIITVFEDGLAQLDVKTKSDKHLRVIGRLKNLGKRFIISKYKIDRLKMLGIDFRLIPRCNGYGRTRNTDYDLLVPDESAEIVQEKFGIEPVSYTVRFGNSIIMPSKPSPFVVNGKPKEVISLRIEKNDIRLEDVLSPTRLF